MLQRAGPCLRGVDNLQSKLAIPYYILITPHRSWVTGLTLMACAPITPARALPVASAQYSRCVRQAGGCLRG